MPASDIDPVERRWDLVRYATNAALIPSTTLIRWVQATTVIHEKIRFSISLTVAEYCSGGIHFLYYASTDVFPNEQRVNTTDNRVWKDTVISLYALRPQYNAASEEGNYQLFVITMNGERNGRDIRTKITVLRLSYKATKRAQDALNRSYCFRRIISEGRDIPTHAEWWMNSCLVLTVYTY